MTALEVPLHYGRKGRGLAWAAMAGARSLVTGRHYPEHDVVDRQAHTRFYYHAHAIEGGEAEHGHFHVFHERASTFHHLAALSLDAQGRPLRWFCTNQWVTGEAWPPPANLIEHVAGFQVHTRGKMAPVARWLQAMWALYREEIASLIQARDRLLQGMDAPQQTRFGQDRTRHVLVSQPIDLAQRIQGIVNPTGEHP